MKPKFRRRDYMKVEEIMTKEPACVTLETSLHDVAQLMMDYDCGCIPVFEEEGDKKPIGVITDRDITIRTVAHNKNPLNMIVGEAMSDNIITVTPETSLEDCCQVMERNQIRRVPVVDEEGNLQGIVAQADIAQQASAKETAELVKDISTSTSTATA